VTVAGFEQQAPAGFEFTGEFRVPKDGEAFSIPGERPPRRYLSGALGKRRLILRKVEHVVQVFVFGYKIRSYNYTDPTGALQEGDVVEVPFGYSDEPMLGRVVGLGRDRYKGSLKTVTARYERVEL
jgi:hypothetical protein